MEDWYLGSVDLKFLGNFEAIHIASYTVASDNNQVLFHLYKIFWTSLNPSVLGLLKNPHDNKSTSKHCYIYKYHRKNTSYINTVNDGVIACNKSNASAIVPVKA